MSVFGVVAVVVRINVVDVVVIIVVYCNDVVGCFVVAGVSAFDNTVVTCMGIITDCIIVIVVVVIICVLVIIDVVVVVVVGTI